MSKKDITRLQDFVHPEHYTISIEPSEDMNSYSGSVQIKLKLTKPTKNIILHSKNSKIKTTTICVGTQCLLPKVTENKESETINLEVLKEISGDIEIHIEFDGIITEDLAGIYKSTYEHNGEKKHLITTQCEAPYARRIFPCFDEPEKKATFNLQVTIPSSLKAISNTLPESEKNQGSKKIVNFKTSPKMSTYLLYIGIGDWEFSEDKYKNVKIRIVTTPGKSNNTRFAMEKTKQYLQYFEEYSEVPYPLEKLDLIAVPDFNVGGMENWGAITFREVVLLIDEKTSAARRKLSAEVISHELWHQWSGDLVTMKWWEDLWLNESFANYMAFKAVHHYNSEWNIWDDYLSADLGLGLFKDSLKTTHPIKVEVKNPDEIGEIFDEISYQKGGSILRMLDNFMGEEQFRKGVSNYLKKYAYSNATASDFWNCLKEYSHNKKVKEMMESWISEPGYPLISVEKSKLGIKISQNRFNENTSQIWPVPISIYEEGKENKILLEKKEEEYSSQKITKLNHKHFGFYRTKYSEEILLKLGKMIKENKLPKEDRWGIHNDLWALCSFTQIDVKKYLEFLDNYLSEDNYITLAEISSNIRKIDRIFYYKNWWPKVRDKILKKFLPTYKSQLKRLGWKNKPTESTDDKLLRSLCISFCGYAYDKETIEQAKSLYISKEIELDIANPIYFIVARDGDEKTFKEMVSRYESTSDLEMKVKLLGGLACFFNPELLSKALDYGMGDKVKSQNLLYIFRSMMINPSTQKIILNWAKKNWNKFDKYQDNHYIMRDFVDPLVICQVTQSARKEVKELLEKNNFRYQMIKANAFEILDQNLKFIEKNREFLKNY